MTESPQDRAKRAAAEAAVAEVKPGMKLGLGTGSTANLFIGALGARVREGGLDDVTCVPTSVQSGRLAERERLRLATLERVGWLDLTVDGADEIGPGLNLIKGGGGALLQEKIVACASDRMLVIADDSKHVDALGAFPLPIEVVPFGWETTAAIVRNTLREHGWSADVQVSLRLARDEPFLTDGGHFIFDLKLGRVDAPAKIDSALRDIPGVIDTGLFVGIADRAIIGREDGSVEFLGLEG